MKPRDTAEAISLGGRSGTLRSPDQLLNVTLGHPLDPGAGPRGPSPELLFAGAYAACFHGALQKAARRMGPFAGNSTVRALVSLVEDAEGGHQLEIELHARIPGFKPSEVHSLLHEAHQTCPYSRALRGENTVKLLAD
jgi:osmotically inducible protein OsmC